jgi:hypothetical protein
MLHTQPLEWKDWLIVVALGLTPALVGQTAKLLLPRAP